ncbi:hypothetical protein SESBI_42885 [Sesbania bispinosa]|nr:hypothetical protein SESBI_42885 [Sesbania bispinosa]
MQQRSSGSNTRCSCDEHRAINIGADQQQQAKRRRNPDDDLLDSLPLYHLRSTTGRREISRPRSSPAEKWIHAIPMLVLLCLFTLWWFSFRVDVEMKDGRITAIRQIDIPLLNETRIDLTILAVAASSPIPSIPQDLLEEEETYMRPASSPN